MEEVIKVATLENEFEAQLLDLTLKEQKIPYFIGTYHDVAYNGIFQIQKGWGYVKAPVSYKKQIKVILENIRKSRDIPFNNEIGE